MAFVYTFFPPFSSTKRKTPSSRAVIKTNSRFPVFLDVCYAHHCSLFFSFLLDFLVWSGDLSLPEFVFSAMQETKKYMTCTRALKEKNK